MSSGADSVRVEIDGMNQRYTDLLDALNRRLRQLKSVYDASGAAFPVSPILFQFNFLLCMLATSKRPYTNDLAVCMSAFSACEGWVQSVSIPQDVCHHAT